MLERVIQVKLKHPKTAVESDLIARRVFASFIERQLSQTQNADLVYRLAYLTRSPASAQAVRQALSVFWEVHHNNTSSGLPFKILEKVAKLSGSDLVLLDFMFQGFMSYSKKLWI